MRLGPKEFDCSADIHWHTAGPIQSPSAGPSLAGALFELLCSDMACSEAVRVEHQLTQAQSALEKAERQLEKRAGVASRREYQALSTAVEQASASIQNLQSALEQHLQEHSCSTKTARA